MDYIYEHLNDFMILLLIASSFLQDKKIRDLTKKMKELEENTKKD